MELFRKLSPISRTALMIFLVGLFLRALFISVHQRTLISDERDYHQLAAHLLSTGTYGFNGVPTAYRPFAYPAIISGVYALAGQHPIVIKLLQALFDSLTAVFLFLLLKHESEKVRLAALGLWSFYLPAILYTNFLLSESLFTFILVLTSFILVRNGLSQTRNAFLFGCSLGFLTLMKPAMVLLIISLPAVMYLARIPLQQFKVVVVGALLILFPWIVRNYSSMGKPTLATNGGINLLIGNNPNTTGAYVINFPEEILQNAKDEVEADEAAYRYALHYIMDKPGQFLVNGFKKIAHLFSSEGGLLVWSFHNHPEDASERYAMKYASIPLPLIALVNASYIVVVLFGLVGIVSAKKDMLWWFCAGLFACWLATHFLFFGGSRFHFPLMPFFALFAAPALTDLSKTFQRLTTAKKIFLVLAVLGFLSIWIAETSTVIHALSAY